MPAFRASWKRALESGEDPFDRVTELATDLHDSRDNDLLPIQSDKAAL